MKPASILFCLVLAASVAAGATPIPISNPGFESPAHLDGGWSSGIPGWAVFGGVGYGAGTFNPTTAQYSAEAPEGANVGTLVTYNSAGMAQTLTTTYQAGQTYTLSALVGDRDDYTGAFYELKLLAGGVPVAATGPLALPIEGGFSPATLSLDADATLDGQAIGIQLWAWPGGALDPDQDPGATGSITDFDDVRLESAPTAAAEAGRVPVLSLGKTPSGDVQLDWQPSCSSDDDDYAVFGGDLGLFTSHVSETCSTGGMTGWVLPPPAGNRYYLVVPLDGTAEGSYGRDSFGAERPAGSIACGTQSIAATCP